MEWILKLIKKFKNKSSIIINDSLDVTDIKPAISGKVLVIKSTNIDEFLTMKLPDKFFLIDVFPDNQINMMLDLDSSMSQFDATLEKRATLRQILSKGTFDVNISEKILNKLCKRK